MILRPFYLPKIPYVENAINNLEKNLDLNNAEETNFNWQYDNQKFFNRRAAEFEVLRKHLDKRAKVPVEPIHNTKTPKIEVNRPISDTQSSFS